MPLYKPDPDPAQPPLYERLMNGLLGKPQSYGGLLSAEDQKSIQQQQLLSLGANLMAAGGPSPVRTSLGQALAPALQGAQQTGSAAGKDMLTAMLLKTKIAKAGQPTSTNAQKDYEYAKANGFNGSFEDWKKVASAQPQTPAAIQQYEYWNKLPTQAEKDAYLTVQRNMQPYQVADMAGGRVVFNRATGNWEQATTVGQEAAGAGQIQHATAAGGALGKAEGDIQGGIETKGSNAVTTQGTLDMAEPLIDVATGSLAGAARDKLFAAFGSAPDSAQAIAQLKVMQANLMTSMPRMEGPQSDRDVDLYREAAGKIGDPTVPAAIKKAAVKTIREIQNRYVQRASGAAAPAGRVVRKFNPATGKIE